MFVFRRVLALGFVLSVMAPTACAQAGGAPRTGSTEEPLVFKSKVNLIMAPVVVRDRKGNAVARLQREDFQLFDNGKLQVISSFSVEAAAARAIPAGTISPVPAVARTRAGQPSAPPVVAPDRFIGFYIDDVHLDFGDLAQTRAKLQKFISTRLEPGDRAAIFTTSGKTILDFTDDGDKLNATARRISPHPLSVPWTCPTMSILEADRIANRSESDLIARKAELAMTSTPPCAKDLPEGAAAATGAARVIMGAVEIGVRNVLTDMRSVVRLMGEKPGKRILVLASPGFVRPTSLRGDNGLIDQAIRSGVVINTLDARGLVTSVNPMQEAAQSDILWELASGTGGKFIHNTNDLGGAFAKLAEAPEVTYLIGFSPENLVPDGKFHSLKVKVNSQRDLDVQARIGYYAPKQTANAGDTAKDEIHKALFGREEMREIGVGMTTELSKISDSETKLTIVANVDITKLNYRKVDGKNSDDVEVVCGLFDRNGAYVEGVSNTITLRLVDNVVFHRENGMVPLRAEFKVAPGAYRIRLVARDTEGGMMSTQDGSVDIPK